MGLGLDDTFSWTFSVIEELRDPNNGFDILGFLRRIPSPTTPANFLQEKTKSWMTA
jgi:hypothetical protein